MESTSGSIAIVGGSREKFYTMTLTSNARTYGFSGPIYLVNPRYADSSEDDEVANISEIEGNVDLGIVQVRSDMVEGIIDQLAAKGCRLAVVFSDGFAETGTAAGIQRQADLSSRAKQAGVTIVGPNSLGYADFHSRHVAIAGPIPQHVTPGSTSIFSDSGAMVSALLNFATHERVGIHRAVSIGNGATHGLQDWLGAACDWEETRSAWVYSEGISSDSDTLIQAISAFIRSGRQIYWYLSGISDAGVSAAQSHTGRLLSRQTEARAFLESAGVHVYDNLERMVRAAALESDVPFSPARKIVVLSSSGGGSIAVADSAAKAGLMLAEFSAATTAALGEHLGMSHVHNPLDFTAASGDIRVFAQACELAAADSENDLIVYAFPVSLPPHGPIGDRHMAKLEALAGIASAETPVIVAVASPQEMPERVAELEARTPHFTVRQGMDLTLSAVASLTRGGTDTAHRLVNLGQASTGAIGRPASEDRIIEELRATAVLSEAGITFVEHQIATNAAEAERMSHAWSVPIVLKGVAAGLAHKQGEGLVEVAVCPGEEARQSATRLLTRMRALSESGDSTPTDASCIILQPMLRGHELFFAVRRSDIGDALTVVFGLGGSLAECTEHLAIGYLRSGAALTAASIKEYARAAGLERLRERFHPAALENLCQLANSVINYMRSTDGADCTLVELNPVIVSGDGSARAVDSLLVRKGS